MEMKTVQFSTKDVQILISDFQKDAYIQQNQSVWLYVAIR